MKKQSLLRLIRYELFNLFGSWYIPIFGLLMPIFLGAVIGNAIEIPTEHMDLARTGITIGFTHLIPLAAVFLGHAALYSQELENNIQLRMQLFGFPKKHLLIAKMLSQLIFIVASLAAYFTVMSFTLPYKAPTPTGLLIFLSLIFVESIALFILAHAIASMLRRFGYTYAVSMGLYFVFMFFGGMMGFPMEKLPGALKSFAKLLPFSYFSDSKIVNVWLGKNYNFAPLLQSLLFLLVVSLLLLLLSAYLQKHKTRVKFDTVDA